MLFQKGPRTSQVADFEAQLQYIYTSTAGFKGNVYTNIKDMQNKEVIILLSLLLGCWLDENKEQT